MNLPGLSLLDRLALRILHRSPRTSLVIVKPMANTLMSYSVHQDDPIAVMVAREVLQATQGEPPSHLLERIFHQPAYGEDE